MKRLILTSLFLSVVAQARIDIPMVDFPNKKLRIAVIDTGLDEDLQTKPFICEEGSKDFTGTDLQDRHGHGTHVSTTIDQYAKNYVFFNKDPKKIYDIKANYCQITLKFFDTEDTTDDAQENTNKALKHAIEQKVDMINYSAGGKKFNQEEHDLIIEALDKGIIVVVAAGNESDELNKDGDKTYYPAMYDERLIVVGNLKQPMSKTRAPSSNYGPVVTSWEVGTNVFSRINGHTYGFLTGTSQAAAIKSGKLVRKLMSHQ